MKNPERVWAQRSISNHRRSGKKVKISIKELTEMAKNAKHCPICGIKLEYGKGGMSRSRPTTDRISNENIMTKYNIWIICNGCNITKYDRTLQQFVNYCKMVVNKRL